MRSILSLINIAFLIFGLIGAIIGLVGITAGLVFFFRQSETTPEIQAKNYIYEFQTSNDPVRRISSLAGLFELGEVNPVYGHRAQDLFAELPRRRQLALFDLPNPQDVEQSLITVVENVYDTLRDTPPNNNLLRAMASALNRLDNRSALKLASEIDGWLRGRDYVAQGNYPLARNAYTAAIFINNRNPLTYYERALVLIALTDYEYALFDFNTAVRLDETLLDEIPPINEGNEALFGYLQANSGKYPYLTRIVPPPIEPSPPTDTIEQAIPAALDIPAPTDTPISVVHAIKPLAPVNTPEPTPLAKPSSLLEVTKTVTPAKPIMVPNVALSAEAPLFVSPGGEIIFTLKVENKSGQQVNNITVKNQISEEYILFPRNISKGWTLEGDTIIWSSLTLTKNQTITLTWRGTVSPNITSSQEIKNTPTLYSPGLEGTKDQTHTTISLIVMPEFILSIEAPPVAKPGESIIYALVVRNISKAAVFDVVITSTIDDDIINPGHVSKGGDINGGRIEGNGGERQVIWQIDRLDPGESKTLRWKGEVNPFLETSSKSSIISTATVEKPAGINSKKATATVTTTVYGEPIRLTKNASFASFPGGPFVSSLTIQNTGHKVHRIEVFEDIPPCVQFPTNISHGGVFEGNKRIAWYLDSLDALETVELSWQGTICLNTSGLPTGQQMDTITSTATVMIAGTPHRGMLTATTFLQPLLLFDIATTPVEAGPGEIITYTLTVQTQGVTQGTASDFFGVVVVRNPIPQHINIDPTGIKDGGQLLGNEIVWEIPKVASNTTKVMTWTGRVDPLAPVGTEVVNTATANDEWGQLVTAEAKTTIVTQSISLDISATNPISRGEKITYTLKVQNTGQTKLFDIEVRDPVPTHILTPTLVSQNGGITNTIDSTVTWTLQRLDAGATVELIWQGIVDPITPAGQIEILNEATLSTTSGLSADARAVSVLNP